MKQFFLVTFAITPWVLIVVALVWAGVNWLATPDTDASVALAPREVLLPSATARLSRIASTAIPEPSPTAQPIVEPSATLEPPTLTPTIMPDAPTIGPAEPTTAAPQVSSSEAPQLQVADQGYRQDGQSLSYAFFVENPDPAKAIAATGYQVTMFDNEGKVLKTYDNVTPIVLPQQRLAIANDMYVENGMAARMEVQLKRQRFEETKFTAPLAVENVTTKQGSIGVVVAGTVQNTYPQDLEYVWVSSVFYDGEGHIIGGGTKVLDFVPASGKIAFEVNAIAVKEVPAKVDVYAAVSNATK